MILKVRTNPLFFIVALGIIIRILFLLIGAPIYFGRSNIFIDGDTRAWGLMFENLWNHGVFSLNLNHEYGYFGRMPGYSFFMGFFWLLTGKNWELAYPIIGWLQTLCDGLVIYFVYHIALYWFKKRKVALIASLLYAFYPFIIVWTPVVYSEWLSVFFLFWSLYVLKDKITPQRLFFAAVLIGLGALNRPQLLLIIPFYLYFICRSFEWKSFLYKGLAFSLGILFSYGLWPVRNYVNHHKIILTQDLRGINNWDVDVLAFLQYIYSVKAEWEPQFSQIIENKKVDWPANAYTSADDSLKLVHAVYNAQNCSRGFSYWNKYWKDPIENEGCTVETAELFNALRTSQIDAHPLNFYLVLPLENLKKAFFKICLTKPSSRIAGIVGSLLFTFRSLLLLLGIIGGMVFRKKYPILWIVVGYFMVLYLTLCFGASPQMRNVEMRYFFHADLMLLFPVALFIDKLISSRRDFSYRFSHKQ